MPFYTMAIRASTPFQRDILAASALLLRFHAVLVLSEKRGKLVLLKKFGTNVEEMQPFFFLCDAKTWNFDKPQKALERASCTETDHRLSIVARTSNFGCPSGLVRRPRLTCKDIQESGHRENIQHPQLKLSVDGS